MKLPGVLVTDHISLLHASVVAGRMASIVSFIAIVIVHTSIDKCGQYQQLPHRVHY